MSMLLTGCHDKSVLDQDQQKKFWPNTLTIKAVMSIWSRYFSVMVTFHTPSENQSHTPSSSSRCLGYTWAITKLNVSSSFISPSVISGRSHIWTICHLTLNTHQNFFPPLAKIFSFSPSCSLKAEATLQTLHDASLRRTLHVTQPVL